MAKTLLGTVRGDDRGNVLLVFQGLFHICPRYLEEQTSERKILAISVCESIIDLELLGSGLAVARTVRLEACPGLDYGR